MIYVAASSREIDRAKAIIKKLRDNGIAVTSTWPEQILNVGEANPADASTEQRALLAATCLREVADANIFWYLYPPKGVPTSGAHTEYGFALAAATIEYERTASTPRTHTIIVSGNTEGTIFPALVQEYQSDVTAFAHVLEVYRKLKISIVALTAKNVRLEL